jgi:hypothetical protein
MKIVLGCVLLLLGGCALNDRQLQELVLMNDIVQRREDGLRARPATYCNPNIFGGFTCQ